MGISHDGNLRVTTPVQEIRPHKGLWWGEGLALGGVTLKDSHDLKLKDHHKFLAFLLGKRVIELISSVILILHIGHLGGRLG